MTPTTIGLTLGGFLLGLVVALLIGRSRTHRLQMEHTAQNATAQSEAAARQGELEVLRSEHQRALADLQGARDDMAAQAAQLSIAEAELQEVRASEGEIEDRLNAAEARILTTDALIDQHQVDREQWGQAYNEVKVAYTRLYAEHLEMLARLQILQDELQERRAELDELTVSLDTLHDSQRRRAAASGPDGQEIELAVAAVGQARADAETALRRREMDLAEVQSQLQSMRHSINILTSAGAELARRVVEDQVVDYDARPPQAQLAIAGFAGQPPLPSQADAAIKELADLRGMIADWYAEMRPHLQFDPTILLLFGGTGGGEPATGMPGATVDVGADGSMQGGRSSEWQGDLSLEGTAGSGATGRMPVTARVPVLPPALMLASIKASAMTNLERDKGRGEEVARELRLSRARYDGLADEIQAWRTMLNATLSGDPDILQLLDERRDASAGEVLSACATVALTAYQKKQEMLDRMSRGLAEPAPSAPPPSPTAVARSAGSARSRGRSVPARG